MSYDDDATIIQNEEDRERIRKEILSGRYDMEYDDDVTQINLD